MTPNSTNTYTYTYTDLIQTTNQALGNLIRDLILFVHGYGLGSSCRGPGLRTIEGDTAIETVFAWKFVRTR